MDVLQSTENLVKFTNDKSNNQSIRAYLICNLLETARFKTCNNTRVGKI